MWDSQLSKLTKANGSDDFDVCRAFTRLFADCAESFLDYLISPQMDIQIQSAVFQQLLDCAQFPYANEIARIPLKLFYDVSLVIHHVNDSQTACQLISPYYSRLILVSVHQMLLPSNILRATEKFHGSDP